MAKPPLQTRSLGLKILAVGLIVILLSIPLMFVNILSWERAGRAGEVRAEVGEAYGGSQLVRGPYLVLPVLVEIPIEIRDRDGEIQRTEYRRSEETIIVSAASLDIDIQQESSVRRRAIYEVPVFNAAMEFTGRFAPPDLSSLVPEHGTIQWNEAQIIFAISDLRAIGEDLDFRIAGRETPLSFEPQTPFDRLQAVPLANIPDPGHAGSWQGIAASAGPLEAGQAFDFTARLRLSGADTLLVTASGRETRIALNSDWPHPSFIGAYLPGEREISAEGYTASWQVPYLARGVPGAWREGDFDIRSIDRTAFGARLFTPTDGYTSVGRSLKYAIFFIGFLMLMFFLVEAASRDRIHAAQYILIGLAQVVFYLLLLAFSEHMATLPAYLTASAATVGLTSLYAATAFKSKARGFAVFAVLGVIYAMQYALVLLEDYALLIGSILAFFAVALTMYVTRRLNWYDLVPEKSAS